ncbi:MAG: hypothetical protein HYV27_21155 [Candidatus Hydrogenedentes bacterium]|nr:hypothetical protein [Candidatus Hydrogenedentota bacterium]
MRHGKRLFSTVLILTTFAAGTTATAAAPIALHPENPHYFLWRDKPAVLVTSAEHYGAVLNLDFDFNRYLAELQKHGLNLTRTFSGTYVELPHSFGITGNPLSPEPARYITPWARSSTPGINDRGPKFDLTQWDPAYFERLKDFMSAAAQAGVVVEFTLFCTLYEDPLWNASPMYVDNNVNGVGTCPRQEVFKLMHDDLTQVQLAVTRKLVQELHSFDNLIYEVCNEPYVDDCVNLEWQHRIVDAIVEEETQLGSRHLISMNIANQKARVDSPNPHVLVLNFHYAYPPETVAMNQDHNRVIGDNETGFRGKEDFPYRSEGWDFLLAGGALFNHLDWSFTPPHPDGDFTSFDSPGGGGPAIRQQVAVLKRFLEEFDFVRMQPDASLASALPKGFSLQLLAEPGMAYALYLRAREGAPEDGAKRPVEFLLELPAGAYAVEWLDPKSGERSAGEALNHAGGPCRLVTPPFLEDVALALRRHPAASTAPESGSEPGTRRAHTRKNNRG